MGALGNRSQPDDFMSHLLYKIFNEPMVTKRTLQKTAYIILLAQVVYIFTLRDRTMIPFCIVNFMMHTLYVHIEILYVEDFRRKQKSNSDLANGI